MRQEVPPIPQQELRQIKQLIRDDFHIWLQLAVQGVGSSHLFVSNLQCADTAFRAAMTRFRPPSFAAYNLSSAARKSASAAVPSSGYMAAPMLMVTFAPPAGAGIASTLARMRSAMAARAGASSWGR